MNWTVELNWLEKCGVTLKAGLSDAELAAAESRVGCDFPPDLRSFLQTALPVGDVWPDWRNLQSPMLEDKLAWPCDGFAFDINNGVFWHHTWEQRPGNTEDAIKTAARELANVPSLIPIACHVYLPAQPKAAGNPPLSIYQTDIIYGGRNLSDYLLRFMKGLDSDWTLPRCDEVQRLRFWSDVVEWNEGCIT